MQTPFLNGLHNKGNMCYMNSILQCLYSIEDYVLNFHDATVDALKRNQCCHELIELLVKNVVAQYKNEDDEIHYYFTYKMMIREFNYGVFTQQDASQFYIQIMDIFNQFMSRKAARPNEELAADYVFLDITRNFECSIVSQNKCTNGHLSYRFENSKILHLPLTNPVRLEESLSTYFRSENLNCICGNMHLVNNSKCNAFFCSTCQSYVDKCIRTSHINYLPKNLVIQFNLCNIQGQRLNYIFDYKSFRTSIDLQSYLSSDYRQFLTSKYELSAICIHQGANVTNGHYTALCKNIITDEWRYYNDEAVELLWVPPFQYMESKKLEPYLLFYQQHNDINDMDDMVQRFASPALSLINAGKIQPLNIVAKIASNIPFNIIANNKSNSSVVIVKSTSKMDTIPRLKFINNEEVMDTDDTDIILLDDNTPEVPDMKQIFDTNKIKVGEAIRNIKNIKKDTKITKKRLVKASLSNKIRKKKLLMRTYRKNYSPNHINNLRQKNTEQHRKRREDSSIREGEQLVNTMQHSNVRNSKQYIINKYENNIKEGPDYICVSCVGLFFYRSVAVFKRTSTSDNKYVARSHKTDGKEWICVTCYRYAKYRNEIPPLCLNNHDGALRFQEQPEWLNDLTRLEIRLVSPRLPFMRIVPLGWDKQWGLRGNVVNVPINVEETLNKLPRSFNQSETIQLKLMRKLEYTKPYMYDEVRPKKMLNAVKKLLDLPLFRRLRIELSEEWLNDSENSMDKRVFIVDPKNVDTMDDVIWVEDEDVQLLETAQNTMIVNENDPITIAPAQTSKPIALNNDQYAEEASFIKIFCGNIISDELNKLNINQRCKSYFRRGIDRRCAEDTEYLFYMYRKLMAAKLVSTINIALKKHRINRLLTAGDVLNRSDTGVLAEYFTKADARRFFRNIRSSPEYWEQKKKNLFAMIRQLGCPTLFITLSPAEIDWPELIRVLKKVLDNEDITLDAADALTKDERLDLVRRDPITVSRYFENRIRHLLTYMCHKKNGPFSAHPIIDYFWRIEFQTRGSPHVHMMTWNENRPTYYRKSKNENDNVPCIEFIDKYITAEYPGDDGYVEDTFPTRGDECVDVNVQFQRHLHLKNCIIAEDEQINEDEFEDFSDINANNQLKRDSLRSNAICKYLFPWPILDSTIILEPYTKDMHNTEQFVQSQTNYKFIRAELTAIVKERYENESNDLRSYTIKEDEFRSKYLDNMSRSEYIDALRTSISRSTVFIKRNSADIMINNYNRDIFTRWRTNMDIQFILDAYALVIYLTSYMMKGNRVMSTLLDITAQECIKQNTTVRSKFKTLAQKYQNCSEVGAQECCYHLLSMPVSYSSRETVFILTFHEYQRYSMLKAEPILQQMSDKSSDIYALGLLDHYKCRPYNMEDMCLAEFSAWYDYFSNIRFEQMKDPSKKTLFDEDMEAEADDDLFDDENRDLLDEPNMSSINDDEDDDMAIRSNDRWNRHVGIKFDPLIHLKLIDNSGYIQRRKRAKILRYRRYNKDKEPEEYYREQLLLFTPWRNEKNEIEDIDHELRFKTKRWYEIIVKNRHMFDKLFENGENKDPIDENFFFEYMKEQFEKYVNEVDRHEAIVLNQADKALVEQMDTERLRELFEDEDYDSIDKLIEIAELQYGFRAELSDDTGQLRTNTDESRSNSIKPVKKLSDNQYVDLISSLNQRQYIFFINILQKIKRKDVFHYFVTGSAGTGKTRLISAIQQALQRHVDAYDPPKSHYDPSKQPHVLLSAFTGKAAFNIRGTTLHTAFGLDLGTKYNKPAQSTLDELRTKYLYLRLLIIDEISLVGLPLWEKVNKRLQDIKNNTQIFGGIPVIVFGDFNQLDPVMQSKVFSATMNPNDYAVFTGPINYAWSHFRIWRLLEIMRQANDKTFAEALTQLGNYGLMGLTNKQIKLFNSRIVKKADIPLDAIYLFYTNANVDIYNKERIKQMNGKLIEHIAQDRIVVDGKKGKLTDAQTASANGVMESIKSKKKNPKGGFNDKQPTLPYVIYLKEQCKYQIVININLSDGIFNGTCGVLKYIETNSKGNIKRLWFDYIDEDIGHDLKLEYFNQTSSIPSNIPIDINGLPLWTPIVTSQENISQNKGEGLWHIQRIQFPITESEALTIHKSQGITYTCVAVDISQSMKTALLYVAFSRATKLVELHLFGATSIVENKTFMTMSFETRFAIAKERSERLAHNVELKRMEKEMPFINKFTFLDDLSIQRKHEINVENSVCIYFHNINGLKENIHILNGEKSIQMAHVLIFVNTKTDPAKDHDKPHPNANIHINNFKLMVHTGNKSKNKLGGCCMYAHTSFHTKIQIYSTNAVDTINYASYYHEDNEDSIEVNVFELTIKNRPVKLMSLFKHSNKSDTGCIDKLLRHLVKDKTIQKAANGNYEMTEYVFVLGTFNFSYYDTKFQSTKQFNNLQLCGFENLLYESTNDENKFTDWILASVDHNVIEHEAIVYESYYSFHKPLWLYIKHD